MEYDKNKTYVRFLAFKASREYPKEELAKTYRSVIGKDVFSPGPKKELFGKIVDAFLSDEGIECLVELKEAENVFAMLN
jgi:hypothetical protein